jgi:hypothetical protein
LALRALKREAVNDDSLWWNKLKNMSEYDIDMLPFSFLKKYGTFLTSLQDHALLQHAEASKTYGGRWE